MQVDIDRLWQYEADGKLRHSVHPSRDLHVWCYSQATVYNRDWDDLTRLCRGLVTTSDGTIVSRPFPKFFNWGEPGAPDDVSRPFIAYDKMDGSLICVGLDPDGERVVSTKGSFTTWHSEKATELLGAFKPRPGWTAVFELIDPGNRIVINYPESQHGLWLLGAVENETGEDHFTPDDVAEGMGWQGEVVVSRVFRLQNMLNTVKDPANGENKEGFVLVYPAWGTTDPDGTYHTGGPSERVKIKFAQYILLHHTLSRISNVGVWEALKDGLFNELLDLVPDEMYDRVRETADELRTAHTALIQSSNLAAARARSGRTTRREQAEWVLANCQHPSLVFKALDDKDLSDVAWLLVKPELDRSWTFLK